jgi:MFS family permease
LNEEPIRGQAYRFIVLMGVVSLLADITYEGARSGLGQYLHLLGASAAVVGLVSGVGEVAGYALRLPAGYAADRTRAYWPMTFLGYLANLAAVPLLALASNWQWATVLAVVERLGKGLRTPARDAMLSHAARVVGRGWGFAIHEALDQVGAVTGPLLVAGVLFASNSYRLGFAALAVPAAAAMVTLLVARLLYPRTHEMEQAVEAIDPMVPGGGLPRTFLFYTTFIAFTMLGFVHFQLVAYHLSLHGVMPDARIPLYYAAAMAVDGLAALAVGRLFDRLGLVALWAVPVLALPVPFLAFSLSPGLVLIAMVLWGVVVGLQETVLRAAVGVLVPLERRGTAFGVFNTAYGLAWFVGSAIMGVLYGVSVVYLVAFAVVSQVAAMATLVPLMRAWRVSRS